VDVATQMVATANQVVGSPRLQAAAASPSNLEDDNLANRATSGTILPTAALVEATKLIERAAQVLR
jgi:hypothetical protein